MRGVVEVEAVEEGNGEGWIPPPDRPSFPTDRSPGGDPRSTDFRYGQTVLLVQLVDVRPRRLDDVRHNGSEGGPAGSGEPDGGRSCPPSRGIEAPRVV
jgi:hypothetical protein